MNKSVTFVEINIYDNMIPLVSGYLQAYAGADHDLSKVYKFHKYTTTRSTPAAKILYELAQFNSDLYVLSCYLWNIGLVKSLLRLLLTMKPQAYFLLGGPQVMYHGRQYLTQDHERVLICNGEGEKTFANFLREFSDEKPDFSRVRGLSFYQEGALITTESEERIQHLDEIPSPFLNGLFNQEHYGMSVLETTRGCPFKCGFCYWGAANNDRVFKFDEERVRDEITWLSRKNIPVIHIADANWGILKRDIGLSEHFAQCKKDYGFPIDVIFSASKNTPQRVAQITKIFTQAGLFTNQPISMQSLDKTSLNYIERQNIKLSSFEDLQKELDQQGIASYVELIWPLPGETLSSFKQGIETLCDRQAHTIIIYPHLLLHNTSLYEQQQQYRLVTHEVRDEVVEADIVVQTADVSYEEFQEGLRFMYAMKGLYNTRSLKALSRYLHHSHQMSYRELFSSFVDFAKGYQQHPFSVFCDQSILEGRYYDVINYPKIYHIGLHAERDAFDQLLYQFVASQPWWDDGQARALFEIDQLNKPFIYSNTPFKQPQHPFERIRVLDTSNKTYLVEIPEEYTTLLSHTLENPPLNFGDGTGSRFSIDHKRVQRPFDPSQSEEKNAHYCTSIIMNVGTILPRWSRASVQSPLMA